MSVKTLRLDVNAGLLPVRRADHGRGLEVDLDAAIDKYAGGAPLVSRMFIAFQDGRTPVEMVVESGLDPILVKRLFDAYVDLLRDPNVAAMKKTCPECHRTEVERTAIAKEFAHACESPGVERVSCCTRCHVPLAWAEVERDEP